jgi:hypothetical protein
VQVCLAEWIVADGELPEPAAGGALRHRGIRANVVALEPGTDLRGTVRPLRSLEAQGLEDAYEVHGVAGPVRDVLVDARGGGTRRIAVEFALNAGTFALLAAAPANDTTRPDVHTGGVLAVRCTLTVVADYEWDSFGLPDVRADWEIDGVTRPRHPHWAAGDYLMDLRPAHRPS